MSIKSPANFTRRSGLLGLSATALTYAVGSRAKAESDPSIISLTPPGALLGEGPVWSRYYGQEIAQISP